MKKPISGGWIWLLSLLVCTVAAAVAFVHFDVPIARLARPLMGQQYLAAGLGSAVLVTGEAATALTLVLVRITRGRLSPLGETLGLACLTSICAYALNASALKFFFGVPNTMEVLAGASHSFHFLQGTLNGSFPSGHMVLAGGFAGVFMRLYRASAMPLGALLLLGAGLLLLGNWHFLSDVIAGSFLGVSAGLLAGELWSVHSR